MIIWCWDFDRTITINHTCTGDLQDWERADLFSQEKLNNLHKNIRNYEWLADFFRKCHAAGDIIFIVTRNPNKIHVETYLNVLLGGEEQRKKIIKDIHCRLKEIPEKPGKNGHIQEVFIKNSHPWPPTDPTSIILVDDENKNCVAAASIGLRAVWVNPLYNSHQQTLEEIFANRSNNHATPLLAGATEGIDVIINPEGSPSIGSDSPMLPFHAQTKIEDIIDLFSAKKYLDENIFNQNAEYAQKQQKISSVSEAFNKLLDKLSSSPSFTACDIMDQLSIFFDHINEAPHKEKLNCHKNKKYDTIFFKKNTTSWSNMVCNFRNKSLAKLLELQKTLPENGRVDFLNKYRNKALFSEHRANSVFTVFYNTDAVNAIDNAIKECEKSTSKISTTI